MGEETTPATQQAFTLPQVAKLIGVEPRTALKWFDRGQLKGYRVNGNGQRKVDRANLIAFLTGYGMTAALAQIGEGTKHRITLADGETFAVVEVREYGSNITGMWDGQDAAGLKVRFIQYREKPGELLFVRYPNEKFGAFTKGVYVTGFTISNETHA